MKKCILVCSLFYTSPIFAQQDYIVAGNPAGLIYSNPEPDITFSAVAIDPYQGYGSASFDLDGDGITDFGIVTFYFTFGTGIFKGAYANGFTSDDQVWYLHNDTVCRVFDQSQYDLVQSLKTGDTVFSNNTSAWTNLAYLGYDDETQTTPCIRGDWTDNTDHYFALRMKKNDTWYYGWMHVSVENFTQLVTVSDYAVQPDVTGISNRHSLLVSVFPNPVHTRFSLTGAAGMNYIIYDENGTNLLSGRMSHSSEIIDASALHPGVYFLKVYDEDRNIVRQLVKF